MQALSLEWLAELPIRANSRNDRIESRAHTHVYLEADVGDGSLGEESGPYATLYRPQNTPCVGRVVLLADSER